MKKVFLENLPRYNSKGNINWKKSVGFKINFIYDDIESYFIIMDYKIKKQELSILYNDKIFNINTGNLQSCKLGKLLSKYTSDFKIEVGTIFNDSKRDITIVDREYRPKYNKDGKLMQNYKWYKYHCNKCGYEDWIVENGLINNKSNCLLCEGQTIVEGINDIPTTAPWMIKYFQGGYDEAKFYTKSSGKKIFPICPDCGRVKDTKVTIRDIEKYKSINCSCSDKIPYPEKFIYSVFKQLKIDFRTQLNKTTFSWCNKYKYDFYFSLNGEDVFTETHGLQHYEENKNWKMSLKEVQANDEFKKELALSNGIKEENYIIIDCRKSELEHIKQSILESRLNELFDLSKIDWLKAEEFALSNLVKKVCEYKANSPHLSCTDIGMIMNLGRSTVLIYIKKGAKLGWCNYNVEAEKFKGKSKSGKLSSKRIKVLKDGIILGIFPSCVELERQSEKLFGVKLACRSISAVCRGERKSHKGFQFNYI